MLDSENVHVPTSECVDLHCFWHDVDEMPQPRGHRRCFECKHLFRTAGELRRTFRRKIICEDRRLWQLPWIGDWWSKLSVLPPPWWWAAWRCVTLRVRDIYFCPWCVHDFM